MMMSSSTEERLSIAVSYVEGKGYVSAHPELPSFAALSLNGLRRKLEEALLPEQPVITLCLDRGAKRERDQRRARSGAR
jgi:hypothetical protein